MKAPDRRLLFLLGISFLQSVHSFRNLSEIYSLYRCKATDMKGLKALMNLQTNDHLFNVDFWKAPSKVSEPADLMVPGSFRSIIEKYFEETGVEYNITVADVEKLILRNEGVKSLNFGYGKRMNDDPILDSEPDDDLSKVGRLRKAKYPFGDYASYADMMKYMRTIEFYYPSFTKIIRIGTTHEGKPIEGLKIGFPISNTTKRAVWIDGNIHAREWASSHTALYVINQLVSGYQKDENITHYVNSLNIFIVPCLNPDGYEYTRGSPVPQVRLWRKNRSPEVCSPSVWGGEKCCEGVDLNRNFDFHWAETGSSYEPCSNLFHGSRVFSEPEANSVKRFLSSDEMWGRVDAFLTFHTYAQLWIYPFSHEVQSYPRDVETLRTTARRAMRRLENVYGTQYRMGTGADTLSPASGGSDDWAKSKMNIKYVYLIELRPEEHLSHGFILHKKELIPTGVETLEGVKEVLDAVLNLNGIVKDPLSPLLRRKQEYRIRLQQEAQQAAALSTFRPTLQVMALQTSTIPTAAKKTTIMATTPSATTLSPRTQSTTKSQASFATTTTATTTTTQTTKMQPTTSSVAETTAETIVINRTSLPLLPHTSTESFNNNEEETTQSFRRPTVPMAPPTFISMVDRMDKEFVDRELDEDVQRKMKREKERIRELERQRDEQEALQRREEAAKEALRQSENIKNQEDEAKRQEVVQLKERRRILEQNELRRQRRREQERARQDEEQRAKEEEERNREMRNREELQKETQSSREEDRESRSEKIRRIELKKLRELQRYRDNEEVDRQKRGREAQSRKIDSETQKTEIREELFEVHHESRSPSVELSRTEMLVSRIPPNISQSKIRVQTVQGRERNRQPLNIDRSTFVGERTRDTSRDMPDVSPTPQVSFREYSRRTTPIPLSFRDPNCRDKRYSCSFWLKNAPNACEVQKSFMQTQCAYTCRFCEPSHGGPSQQFLET